MPATTHTYTHTHAHTHTQNISVEGFTDMYMNSSAYRKLDYNCKALSVIYRVTEESERGV